MPGVDIRLVRLGIGAGVALVIAAAMVALLPTRVLYPEYCGGYGTADGVPIHPGQQWCINYDPNLGRYECPPPGLPCDVVRAAMATASTVHPTLEDRLGAGLVAFLLTFFVFGGGSVVATRVRGHPLPRDIPQR